MDIIDVDISVFLCQDHVDDIDEVGPLNYDILEPVLERAIPQTLIHIEDLNQRKNIIIVVNFGMLELSYRAQTFRDYFFRG